MLDEKDLQAIADLMSKQKHDILSEVSGLMDEKLAPIREDLSSMKEDISQLKENVEIATVALDRVIEWADKVTDSTGFPLPRV